MKHLGVICLTLCFVTSFFLCSGSPVILGSSASAQGPPSLPASVDSEVETKQPDVPQAPTEQAPAIRTKLWEYRWIIAFLLLTLLAFTWIWTRVRPQWPRGSYILASAVALCFCEALAWVLAYKWRWGNDKPLTTEALIATFGLMICLWAGLVPILKVMYGPKRETTGALYPQSRILPVMRIKKPDDLLRLSEGGFLENRFEGLVPGLKRRN